MHMTDQKPPVMPGKCDHFIGGQWHAPLKGAYRDTYNPATGETIAKVAVGSAEDVDAAAAAAHRAAAAWGALPPLQRAGHLKRCAAIIRAHADDLIYLDALNGGNPIRELRADAAASALLFDFFAGLVTEIKGHSIPMGPQEVNFTVREPYGVVARILAFNHPLMFAAAKAAAPLAAGNTVILKPAEQTPLSTLRLAELLSADLPPGVLNVITGGVEAGKAMSAHPLIMAIGLVGSVNAGRSVMEGAAKTIKPVLLELGGKNALIALPDANPKAVAKAVIGGMNFGWCGQSCGSTSRAFLHRDIAPAVLAEVKALVSKIQPGIPTDPDTMMGSLVSPEQLEKVKGFISSALDEGAQLLHGGKSPDDPGMKNGCFLEPTIFTGVNAGMRIAREEIFGPVLSVLEWTDEEEMLRDVNGVPYGLTCAIWTNNLSNAHRLAGRVQAGYVWINEVSKHYVGAPFGGYKHSGIGREEGIEELLSFTQVKNIHINLAPQA
jgi:betaine-aldehyde dehydrogenase